MRPRLFGPTGPCRPTDPDLLLPRRTKNPQSGGERAWPIWGIAMRCCIAMGLHRDGSKWELEPKVNDERRCVGFLLRAAAVSMLTDCWASSSADDQACLLGVADGRPAPERVLQPAQHTLDRHVRHAVPGRRRRCRSRRRDWVLDAQVPSGDAHQRVRASAPRSRRAPDADAPFLHAPFRPDTCPSS